MSASLKKGILITLILIVIWHIAAESDLYSPLVLPAPYAVLKRLARGIAQEALVGQIIRSLKVVLYGLFGALGLTMVMLTLSNRWKAFDDVFSTLCALFHPLPGIAILPVFMIWLGIGQTSIVAVIIHSVLWPLYTNMTAGVRNIPPIYVQVARGFRIEGIGKWIHITLPAVLPYLLSGLRTGWARAWRALIGAEMVFGAIGSGGGLGWFIFKNRVFMDTAGMFAGLVVVIGIGLVVEKGLFDFIENITLRKWGMIE
jgi:NitT/TauT family transport system permease protein